MRHTLPVLGLVLVGCGSDAAPVAAPAFPPVPDEQVARYTAYRTVDAITVDGRLDEDSWRSAERSTRFVDLVSGASTRFDTRAALRWDDECLYAGFWIEEPNVAGALARRDAPIYRENDAEIFIAGPHAYYEFEVNALGTIYEGLFVWQSEYERFADIPELDREDPEVRCQGFDGVGFRGHPRGPRWAFLGWDFPDARVAVHVDGTLNDDADTDRGWTVELAFPWRGMAPLVRGSELHLPPQDGEVWRINCSRFNVSKAPPPAEDCGGWVWSPHGAYDSHLPECFPYVTFTTATGR